MPSSVAGNHLLLIYGLLALLGFSLAFAAISILGRPQWAMLGVLESLVARLCASVVIGLITVGSLSFTVPNLIFPLNGPIDTGTDAGQVQSAKLQTELILLLALGLAIAAVVRVEALTRRSAPASARPEGDEWQVDEPEPIRRRTP